MPRIRDNILGMAAYHPPLAGRAEKWRLDFNENLAGPSPAVLNALRHADGAMLAVYPDDATVTAQAAAHFGVSPAEIILTNGADEAIQCIVNLLIDKGDAAPLFEPTYAMYKIYLSIAGARVETLLYKEDLSFPLARLETALRQRPKLVFLCSPNNPTGTEIDYRRLRELITANLDTLFALDEAYADFSAQTLVNAAPKLPNLLVLRTFSKLFGLAGLRVGAVIGAPASIQLLRKIRSPYSISRLSLHLLAAALQDKDYPRQYREIVTRNRARLETWLRERGVKCWPSCGNFILIHAGDRVGEIVAALAARGILARSRDADPLLKGCFRVTVGTDAAMQAFCDTYQEYL